MQETLLSFAVTAAFCAGAVTAVLVVVLSRIGLLRLAAGIKANGPLLFFLALAFAAGVIVGLIWGGPHTDAMFGFIGGFAGVAGAVGGGLWLWQVQDAKSSERTLAAIHNSCEHYAKGLYPLLFAFSDYLDGTADLGYVRSLTQEAEASADGFIERADRYQDHLIELDAVFQDAHAKLEHESNLFLQDIRTFMAEAGKYTYPPLPTVADMFHQMAIAMIVREFQIARAMQQVGANRPGTKLFAEQAEQTAEAFLRTEP